MDKTLRDFHPGESGIVVGIAATGAIKRRIFDMGITPGTAIALRKVAPLGDPIEIILRGYRLSIRKAEAETIKMSAVK
jgi:Fe2+ transport system protein FeoA